MSQKEEHEKKEEIFSAEDSIMSVFESMSMVKAEFGSTTTAVLAVGVSLLCELRRVGKAIGER